MIEAQQGAPGDVRPHRQIAIFIFDGVTALDAVGPYEALSRLPEVSVQFCGKEAGPVRTHNGFLALQADISIYELKRCDILLIPGGSQRALISLLQDKTLIQQIKSLHETTTYTASVCTGSLVLAAAGLAPGAAFATHWRAKDLLARFGASYSSERVTKNGKVLSSAGVSAGIELGLVLCGLIADPAIGAAVELSMEYCPAPPFGGRSASQASADIIELVDSRLRAQ
jgi:putative intracellular protease/amidase